MSDCVLRIRKAFEDKLTKDATEDDQAIAFQHRVISHLIPPAWLPKLESVPVDASWLKELDELSKPGRPLKRQSCSGSSIDLSLGKAVLSENLVGGFGWAAEIKPKWGFLPNTNHLSSETRDVKKTHCRFCMHKHLKSFEDGRNASSYCPLDLFSGERERMTRSLQNLWDSWLDSNGSVNNLRLFSDGNLVVPSDTSSMDNLRSRIHLSLSTVNSPLSDLRDSFVGASLGLLMTLPVLDTLQRLQRTLDPLDIEGLYALSQLPQAIQTAVCEEPSLEEWEAFIDKYRDPEFQANLDHRSPQPRHLRYYALAYLLSASFKDCSIIIRFHSDAARPPCVSVIDVDVKSIRRLEKWKALDHKIAASFTRQASPVSACVDARKN